MIGYYVRGLNALLKCLLHFSTFSFVLFCFRLPEVDGGYKKLVYSDIMLTSDVTISAVFLTELQCPSAVFPGVGLPFSDLPSHEYVKTLIQSGLILRLPEIYLKDISYISDNSLVSL